MPMPMHVAQNRHLLRSGQGPSSLLSGLVSYWKLEDLTDSAGANALTNNNSVTFVAGKVGNAANLVAASSQSLSVASNTGLQTGNKDWSFVIGMSIATKTVLRTLAAKSLGATAEWKLYSYTDNMIYFDINNGGSGRVVSVGIGAPAANTWTLIICRFDSIGGKGYIQTDGGAAVSASKTGTPGTNAQPFRLGWDGTGGTNYFDGALEMAGLWNRYLTDAECSQLYNSGAWKAYPF